MFFLRNGSSLGEQGSIIYFKITRDIVELLPLCTCINARLARKIRKQCDLLKGNKAENNFLIIASE